MPEEEVKNPKTEGEAGAEQEGQEKKAASPMLKKLILAGIIVVVLIVEAVVAYLLVQATKQEDPRIVAEKKAKQEEAAARLRETTIGMTTEPIDVIVNVAGKDQDERYAKVAVQLEFDDIKYPELQAQLAARVPKIKNILIELLSAMKLEELITPVGKAKLRQSVIREINKSLPNDAGMVRDAFISEFIIQ